MPGSHVLTRASSLLKLGSVLLASAPLACHDAADAPSSESVSTGATEEALRRIPSQARATFTTLFQAPLATEGLVADARGNLYTAGRGGDPCPVYRIPSGGGEAAVVGNIPAPCNPNGLVFDRAGALYVTSGADRIYKLVPDAASPPTGTVFASGVPGANGLAFDRRGNLWVTDGGTAQGRVWSISRSGRVTEQFRIQPLANLVNLDAATQVGGVGRDARALPPGSITVTPTARAAADTAGSVAIVSNGIAFTEEGFLLVTDTARGAIWKIVLDVQGNVESTLGCDATFTPNTLCLENLLIQHPLLEGLDGIVIDRAGTIWGAANERNALVYVTGERTAHQLFRNVPDAVTSLRNTGPLEFPTSPVLVDRKLCVAHTDVARRDNFPNGAGEVGPPREGLAKVSCLDQLLPSSAL